MLISQIVQLFQIRAIKLYKFSFIFLLILFVGCTSVPNTPKIEPITFDKTAPYVLDLSKIQIPDKPQSLYAKDNKDGTLTLVDNPNDADYILFSFEEFNKVVATLEIADTYRNLLKSQEKLVNNYVDQINSLKETVELERKRAIEYRDIWQESEGLLRREVSQVRKTKILGGLATGGIIAGSAYIIFSLL